MKFEDVNLIIKTEELQNYNIFMEHDIQENEVCLCKNGTTWSVFTTDERNCKISEEFYKNEEDAYVDFIERLRADKILRSLY